MTDYEWRIERERHMRRIKSTADAHQLACLRADYNAEFFTNIDPHSASTFDTLVFMMKRAIEAGHYDAVIKVIENL